MDQKNLYALPADGVEMVAMCGGNLQSGMESCVTVGKLPGVDEAFLIGDSKVDGPGTLLRYTGEELDAFAKRWTAERNL
jgi:hypothetical protein